VAGNPPRELPRSLLEEPCGQALFGILVEGLADRFDPALCNAYARLFSQAVASARQGVDPDMLVSRYDRIRWTRAIAGKPRRVFVLSRVTLGADVAVTSVMLAAARKRFPNAELVFVGPRKNFELFAGESHLHFARLEYRRGGLHERLAVWDELETLLAAPDSVVIDPDSRLSQLGLLPVCPEDRCHLFESRAYGSDSDRPLPELASAWAAETFGVIGVKPFVALPQPPKHRNPYIAVSLGVGDNPAKRLPDPFERDLLALLAGTGLPLCVDQGAGGEEQERALRAVQDSEVPATLWDGAFSGFAEIIAGSRLYVGYDSAGQHVAAACGVPLISIFAGFPAPRMFDRWRPSARGAEVIRVDDPDPQIVLGKVRDALERTKASTGIG
jgi:ADP-heptose:LPS heptosyltransferase